MYTMPHSRSIVGLTRAVIAAILSLALIWCSGCHNQVHSVTLSWRASTSPAVEGYNVYRSSQPDGPYHRIHFVGSKTTSYIDFDVTSGSTYYYVVTTVSPSGAESPQSPEVVATVPGHKK